MRAARARPRPRHATAAPSLVAVTVAVALSFATVLAACGAAEPDDTASAAGAPVAAAEHFDVAYAATSDAQRLDLWVPAAPGPVPLVVYVHGGAWEGGQRSEVRSKLGALLEAGFAVASVDYRLSGEARFPAQIHDVKAAIRFLRARAGDYRLDPDRFAAWGSSAGGHLVALVGTSGDRTTALDDLDLGDPTTSSAVQAVVDWYGPVDLDRMQEMADDGVPCPARFDHSSARSPESRLLGVVGDEPALADAADPLTWLAGAAVVPPFSIAHGGADCIVPVAQSQLLADALHEAGVAHDLVIRPTWGHVDPRFDQQLLAPTIDWLHRTLGP